MERTIICISRQYGSGGREIGEAVAKKLGIPCYDKCLIQKAAQEAGLSETAVAEYDEKGEDFGIAVSGNPFADTAALGEAFYSEEAQVFEAERRAILELAERVTASSLAGVPPPFCGPQATVRFPFSSMRIAPTGQSALQRVIIWMKNALFIRRRRSTGCASTTLIFTRTHSGANRKATI